MGLDKKFFKFDNSAFDRIRGNRGAVKYIGTFPPHYQSNADFLYIYSSICEESHINNERGNILRIIPIQSHFGEMIVENFEKPMYVNVNTSRLHQIFLEIRDCNGELLKPHFGNTVCILHFIKNFL